MEPTSSPYAEESAPQEGGEWTLYAWDSRRMQWMEQYRNVPLEFALTAGLRWKSQGQQIRIDSTSGLL